MTAEKCCCAGFITDTGYCPVHMPGNLETRADKKRISTEIKFCPACETDWYPSGGQAKPDSALEALESAIKSLNDGELGGWELDLVRRRLIAESASSASAQRPDEIREWCLHLDLHLTEHDDRHRSMALKAAWPHVSAYLTAVENERDTWRELAKNAEEKMREYVERSPSAGSWNCTRCSLLLWATDEKCPGCGDIKPSDRQSRNG